MKYIKEELEDLIFKQNLSYREIGRKYNVSDTYIKKIANKLGISLRKRANFPEGFKPANTGKSKHQKLNCINCGESCSLFSKKYCSTNCQKIYQHKIKYDDFLKNGEKYCTENFNPRIFKKDILMEQNSECDVCGITNSWNNKNLVFVLDHKDGDASNNKRENLRLICPNCDSQLDTFKSKNKNSARKNRYLSQKKFV